MTFGAGVYAAARAVVLGAVGRTVEVVERAIRRGTGRIRIWRRRWRVTRRETTANAGGVRPQAVWAGSMGALAIGCGVKHGECMANASHRIPQACGRDARPPHTGGGMTQLLTLREVMQMTALSRSAVYVLMDTAQFPQPIRIGRRAVRWVEQEVLDFIASRPRGGSGWPTA